MAFGNLALDLILKKEYGRLVSVHKGFYDSVPITSVTSEKKVVDVKKYYNVDRLRPIYEFDGAPLFIMTSDYVDRDAVNRVPWRSEARRRGRGDASAGERRRARHE